MQRIRIIKCSVYRFGGGSESIHADSTLVGALRRHLPATLVAPMADYETHVQVHRWCAFRSKEVLYDGRNCSERINMDTCVAGYRRMAAGGAARESDRSTRASRGTAART